MGDLSMTSPFGFASALISGLPRLLGRLGLLLVPVGLFAVFVVWNGSIVVGDHSNHQAVVHWAQLAYLSLVTAGLWIIMRPREALSPTALAAACLRSPLSVVTS